MSYKYSDRDVVMCKTESIFVKISKYVSYSLILYGFWICIWTVLTTETGNGDNVEHIHSTWLVAHGKVPYRDFFQHHNPLIWYIFAPFIKFFPRSILLLDIAHSIGMIAGIITFYIVYLISKRFISSKVASLVSLIVLCPPHFYIFCFNYNPDTFMALFLVLGIYYLFDYFDAQKSSELIDYYDSPKLSRLSLSFLSFFLSFMFTQKVLTILGLLGLISIFVFYQNKTPLSDILYSLLLPVLLLFLYIAYLYSEDALLIYWKTNYLFNIEMQDYYGLYKINVANRESIEPSFVLSIISILCFFIKGNRYFKIISILFIAEIIQRYFYFAISPYYMLPAMIFSALLSSKLIDWILQKSDTETNEEQCLISKIIDWMLQKRAYLVFIFLAVGVYYASITKSQYLKARPQNRTFARFLDSHVTPCDYVLSGFLSSQSVISKDPHYYWALLGHVDIAAENMGLPKKPNVTEVVLKHLPKFMYGGIYFNNYAKNRNQMIPVQQVDPEVIRTYYINTPFPDFYILKPEYRGGICRYNKKTKDWEYDK